uniref:Cytochrome b/b6 N-terminal region profile domain-containing protein n=1 Tax=Solanum lycopersicum TaxID=4081 RepID=A0A3Q7EBV9_SOLLC
MLWTYQIGYWAVKIVTGVPDAIPVIGSPLVELLRGSASVGQSTLTRFYSLHTFVLPQHPSMHSVLRLIVTLDGEDVVDCEPILGYLHRGMEKIAKAS